MPGTSARSNRKAQTFLGSRGYARLFDHIEFCALDVGARGGFLADLVTLAPWTNAYGFEPDEAECARLNSTPASATPWRELHFLPVALGERPGKATLHLYRQRGCSSILAADQNLARRYARGDYYELDAEIEVEEDTLDAVIERHRIAPVDYLKTDVQGYELAVFKGGDRTVTEDLLAVRTEVSFLPLYQGQALFSDVFDWLTARDFLFMDFEEIQCWRPSTRVKHPISVAGPAPYARGQLVHADALFLKDPHCLPAQSEADVRRCVRLATLALLYGYVDHAWTAAKQEAVTAFAADECGVDLVRELSVISRHLRRGFWKEKARAELRLLRRVLKARAWRRTARAG